MKDCKDSSNYELLDCGGGRRLERVEKTLFIRQAPQAVQDALLPELWNGADLIHSRTGKSSWKGDMVEDKLPDFHYKSIRMEMRLSENGQIGVYPEQMNNWDWLDSHLREDKEPQRILNGFAYTGASSLVCAAATGQGEVCHLDASRAAVNWARVNRDKSGLPEDAVRFIVDDITVFMEREIRRGRRYSGIILDPPAFGRAKGGKTWVLKRDLPGLMSLCRELLDPRPRFFLLSCHDPEISRAELAALSASVLGCKSEDIETLDLIIPSEKGRSLPNGIAARWYCS